MDGSERAYVTFGSLGRDVESQTFYRGHDYEAATPGDLLCSISDALHNTFARGGGWGSTMSAGLSDRGGHCPSRFEVFVSIHRKHHHAKAGEEVRVHRHWG